MREIKGYPNTKHEVKVEAKTNGKRNLKFTMEVKDKVLRKYNFQKIHSSSFREEGDFSDRYYDL